MSSGWLWAEVKRVEVRCHLLYTDFSLLLLYTFALKKESLIYLPTLFFTPSHYACTIRALRQCNYVHDDAACSRRDTMRATKRL
jgi:hypothetical protein